VPSCEPEDVCQIALMGLWRAVLCFDPQRKAGFAAFARVCIQSADPVGAEAGAAMGGADGQPLGRGGRISAWLEQLPDPRQNLYEQLSERETMRRQREFLATKLSPLESAGGRVVPAAADLPRDCRARMGCSPKAVDNALARIKRKAYRLACDRR
jgi:hypothetical protein